MTFDRDIDADEAACATAPPGPWLRADGGHDEGQRYVKPEGWSGMPVLYSYCPPHAALEFACAAREGWPAYIAEVRRLLAQNEELRLECQRRTTCNEEIKSLMAAINDDLKRLHTAGVREKCRRLEAEVASLKARLTRALQDLEAANDQQT